MSVVGAGERAPFVAPNQALPWNNWKTSGVCFSFWSRISLMIKTHKHPGEDNGNSRDWDMNIKSCCLSFGCSCESSVLEGTPDRHRREIRGSNKEGCRKRSPLTRPGNSRRFNLLLPGNRTSSLSHDSVSQSHSLHSSGWWTNGTGLSLAPISL